MADREFELTSGAKGQTTQLKMDRLRDAAGVVPKLQRDPMDGVTCRTGDRSCAKAHASALNRAATSQSMRPESSLLQLQRQYGNRYVGRVLGIARAQHPDAPPDVERTVEQRRGGGQPLDAGVRRQMESALRADLGGVRVHTDSQANVLNHELSAKAFTTGQDVFFRQGA